MTKSLFTATKYAQFAKALCMSSPQLVAVKNKSNRLSKTTTIIVGDFDSLTYFYPSKIGLFLTKN